MAAENAVQENKIQISIGKFELVELNCGNRAMRAEVRFALCAFSVRFAGAYFANLVWGISHMEIL